MPIDDTDRKHLKWLRYCYDNPPNNGPTYPEGPQPIELEPDRWYLDGDNCLLCPECAAASNNLDEVPDFRPVTPVFDVTDDDYCEQCGMTGADWW